MKKLAAALFVITLAFPFFSQTQNEIDKVDLIISKMSPRAKRELVIFNKAQFVKDLKVVLEEE